jgi:hypothetical protein
MVETRMGFTVRPSTIGPLRPAQSPLQMKIGWRFSCAFAMQHWNPVPCLWNPVQQNLRHMCAALAAQRLSCAVPQRRLWALTIPCNNVT